MLWYTSSGSWTRDLARRHRHNQLDQTRFDVASERTCGVTVSTKDSESFDPGSNPGRSYQPKGAMAQRQRVGFQTRRLGVRIPLASLFLSFFDRNSKSGCQLCGFLTRVPERVSSRKLHQNAPFGPVFSAKIFILKIWSGVAFAELSVKWIFTFIFSLKSELNHATSRLFNLTSRGTRTRKIHQNAPFRPVFSAKMCIFWNFELGMFFSHRVKYRNFCNIAFSEDEISFSMILND